MKEVDQMINFILHQLRAQGVVIPDAVGTAALVAAHATYGGERLYVPKLPKLQTGARIAKAARDGLRTNAEIALATGVSIRQVKRLRRR